MRASWQSLLVTQRGRNGRRGLVPGELLSGLLVLLLAGTLLFMGLGRIRRQARLGRLGADLQSYAKILEQARVENGRWPATAAEAGSRLLDGGWAAGSAFGGKYGWVPPGAAGRPGEITLTAFAPGFPLELSRADLLLIDRTIDDGDLATGRFRTGFNGWPVYRVDVKP